MKNQLEALQGIDIYLLDQFLKNRIRSDMRILDAGCGYGRNIQWMLGLNYDVHAIDQFSEGIESLQSYFPLRRECFHRVEIENYIPDEKFDFIICNAVLHFAQGHEHFEEMFGKLVIFLNPNGILFIRMTSNIGLEAKLGKGENGVFRLPDGSMRYLVTRNQIDELLRRYDLNSIEPIKTVFVDGLRSMTTLVLSK